MEKNVVPSTLINLSGGIDSTYLLWKYLTNKEHVLVHHCNMINHEGRSAPEKIAVDKIISWFLENGLDTFKYIETTFDYGDLEFIVKDIEVVGFMSAVILRSPEYRNMRHIAVSANAHDESNNPEDLSVIRREGLIKLIGPKPLVSEIIFPMLHLTKKEIIDEMPRELLEMTWFCRRPITFDSSGNEIIRNSKDAARWEPCKQCHTCKHVFE